MKSEPSQNTGTPQSTTKLRTVFTCIQRINAEANKEVYFSYVMLKY